MVPTVALALHLCPCPAPTCSGCCKLPTPFFHPSSPTSTSQLSACPYTLQSSGTVTLGTSVCRALSWEGPSPGERPHSPRPPSNRGSCPLVRGSSALSGGVAPTLRPRASHPICAPPLQLTSHRAAVTIHSTASPAGWAPTRTAADAPLRMKVSVQLYWTVPQGHSQGAGGKHRPRGTVTSVAAFSSSSPFPPGSPWEESHVVSDGCSASLPETPAQAGMGLTLGA